MPRKPRSTSIDGTLLAFQAVQSPPLQPPVSLNRKQRVVWDEIIARRARDEWHPIDLRFAAELAGVLVLLHEERLVLDREGSIVAGTSGPKPNPRGQLVELLLQRSLRLSRYLRVHPASDGREAALVYSRRKAEQEARGIVDLAKDFLAH